MESLKGQLLISSGGLYDPNFRHTVVLLAEHGPEGAVGVVLNRPLDVTVEDVIPTLGELVPEGAPLFEGGPVQPSGAILCVELSDPELLDVPVLGGIGFLTGDVTPEIEPQILRARVFAGYSGWGPGQLEGEMEEEAWLLDPAKEDDVFTTEPALLWSRVVRRKGPEYELLSRMPYDPSMN